MYKRIFIDKLAENDLRELPEQVENRFRAFLDLLETTGTLAFPEARKVTRDIFEIRVQHQGKFRGFYAYIGKNFIVFLHLYQKKTQKVPDRHLKTAKQRLKKYK